MFIKKDLRKIPEILIDENDERHELKLSKRAAEFKENIHVLKISKYNTTALCNLRILNLYDNHIKSLEGIGNLDVTPIEEINLGGNDLSQLPLEFGQLTTLRSVWLDDNQFEEFPLALCQLVRLESLRFSSNELSSIPASISALSELATLALDNNLFKVFPEHILTLSSLKHLWLRQNQMKEVPEELPTLQALHTLSLSSNELTSLPTLIAPAPLNVKNNEPDDDAMDIAEDDKNSSYFQHLEKVYLNGNKISEVPDQWSYLPRLKHLNLANNSLYVLPQVWSNVLQTKGVDKKGIITVTANASPSLPEQEQSQLDVILFGNPVL